MPGVGSVPGSVQAFARPQQRSSGETGRRTLVSRMGEPRPRGRRALPSVEEPGDAFCPRLPRPLRLRVRGALLTGGSHPPQVIMLSSVPELHSYIDKSQLTEDLGGTLDYCHSRWLCRRTVSPLRPP